MIILERAAWLSIRCSVGHGSITISLEATAMIAFTGWCVASGLNGSAWKRGHCHWSRITEQYIQCTWDDSSRQQYALFAYNPHCSWGREALELLRFDQTKKRAEPSCNSRARPSGLALIGPRLSQDVMYIYSRLYPVFWMNFILISTLAIIITSKTWNGGQKSTEKRHVVRDNKSRH